MALELKPIELNRYTCRPQKKTRIRRSQDQTVTQGVERASLRPELKRGFPADTSRSRHTNAQPINQKQDESPLNKLTRLTFVVWFAMRPSPRWARSAAATALGLGVGRGRVRAKSSCRVRVGFGHFLAAAAA